MSKKKYELLHERNTAINEAEEKLNGGDIDGYKEAMKQVGDLNNQIQAMEDLDIERGRFADNDSDSIRKSELLDQKKEDNKVAKELDEVLGEKEYTRAFLNALRNRYDADGVMNGLGGEQMTPLRNALTIEGDPQGGQDGGFLVPEDLSHKIESYRRTMIELAPLVTVENVTAPSGIRTVDVAPTKGFTKIDKELAPIPEDDQPEFAQVKYTTDTYGLFIQISNQLKDDNDANLLEYLGRWFGQKQVITENKLIMDELAKLKAATVTGDNFDKLRTILNVTLDPATAQNASLITNQSGFNALDLVRDTTGNYMLQNSVNGAPIHFFGTKSIAIQANKHMPDAGGKSVVYVGDFKQYMTLFRRKYLTVETTSVGGEAWRHYGFEIRGITRLGTAVWDKEAATKIEVEPPKAAAGA